MAQYPAQVPTFTQATDWTGDPALAPDSAKYTAAEHNTLTDEVTAIATELGTDPAGASATVKARLDALDSTVAGKLGATAQAADSAKVGGVTVTGTPTAGQVPVASSGTAAAWGTVGGSSITFTDKGAWAATTAYVVGDVVTSGGLRYLCRTGHTSGGSFAVGTNWVAIDVDLSTTYAPIAGPVSYTGTHNFSGATVTGVSVSSFPSNYVTRTAAYTAAVGDAVEADVSAGGFTVTLPAAPAVGALVSVKKIDASGNTLTIVPASGGTIDGDPSATTTTRWAGAVFEHKGSNVWRVTAAMQVTGPQGPTGAAATVSLGTVATGAAGSSVAITNSGSPAAAVFNFTIPRGDTGATGPQGTAGTNGTNGAISTVQAAGVDQTVRPKLNFVGATVSDDAANSRTTVTISSGGGALSWFGTGPDGALVFDGTNAVTGASRSGTVYTLTRSLFATNITINSGVTVVTAGCILHASGTLTNNGTIHSDGVSASGIITGGGAPAASNAVLNIAGNGANGGSSGAGSQGGQPATPTFTNNPSSHQQLGGAGGAGGAGASTAGGASRASQGTAVLTNFPQSLLTLQTPLAFTGLHSVYANTGAFTLYGAPGGSGGGGDGTNTGGAGGGGGGPVVINAKTIVNAGVIRSTGGNGGNPPSGNCGGGGGGGGGPIVINTTGPLTGGGSVTSAGGTGGTPTGTGVAGSAGSAGVVQINVWL